MLQRGCITREEYTKLLLGDSVYCEEGAAEPQAERQRRQNFVRRMSGKSRPAFLKRKFRKRATVTCKKTIGAARTPKAVAIEKKPERSRDECRDPITLDDLGSWTWDFHASEAATPPVSCGGTAAPKNGGDVSKGAGGSDGTVDKERRKPDWRASPRANERGTKSTAVVTYNVESLVLYLLESGDFQEPTTRRPFSLVQLADLDALAAKAGAKVKGSLVKSYQEGQAKYRERRERREMLVAADRCLGDVVSDMLATIEDSDEPHEEAHVYLVTLFPQFVHIFSELQEADEEFARQCLDQYKGTLRGPPNRPTQEQGGLLRTALEFLGEQGGGETPLEDSEHDEDDVEDVTNRSGEVGRQEPGDDESEEAGDERAVSSEDDSASESGS